MTIVRPRMQRGARSTRLSSALQRRTRRRLCRLRSHAAGARRVRLAVEQCRCALDTQDNSGAGLRRHHVVLKALFRCTSGSAHVNFAHTRCCLQDARRGAARPPPAIPLVF